MRALLPPAGRNNSHGWSPPTNDRHRGTLLIAASGLGAAAAERGGAAAAERGVCFALKF